MSSEGSPTTEPTITVEDQASILKWFSSHENIELHTYTSRVEELFRKKSNIFHVSLFEWAFLNGRGDLPLAQFIMNFLKHYAPKYTTDADRREREKIDQWIEEQGGAFITLSDFGQAHSDLRSIFHREDWDALRLSELDSSSITELINFLGARKQREEKTEALAKAKAKAKAEEEEAKARALVLAQEEERRRLEEQRKNQDTALVWDVRTTACIQLTNEGRTLLRESGSGMTFRTTQGWKTGKHTWSVYIDNDASAGYIRLGFVTSDYPYTSGPSTTLLGDHRAAPGFWSGSTLYDASGFTKAPGCPSACPRYSPGSLITFCLDLDKKEFYIDDLSSTSSVTLKKWYHNLPTGTVTYFPAVSMYPNCKVTLKATLNN